MSKIGPHFRKYIKWFKNLNFKKCQYVTKSVPLNSYSSIKKFLYKDLDNFLLRKLTLKVRILPFLTTFTRLTARPKKLFKELVLVINFGPKERPGRMCDSLR